MRKILHLVIFLILTANLQAQKDSINYIGVFTQQDAGKAGVPASVTIYPVPVKENNFTIRTDKEISFVRITNIIGQDVFRAKYDSPEQQLRIMLDNPKRGMYLVTINFNDGSRVVKKILIETSE
jgi:hypothetical protein